MWGLYLPTLGNLLFAAVMSVLASVAVLAISEEEQERQPADEDRRLPGASRSDAAPVQTFVQHFTIFFVAIVALLIVLAGT